MTEDGLMVSFTRRRDELTPHFRDRVRRTLIHMSTVNKNVTEATMGRIINTDRHGATYAA
jgi:hypothetical protein